MPRAQRGCARWPGGQPVARVAARVSRGARLFGRSPDGQSAEPAVDGQQGQTTNETAELFLEEMIDIADANHGTPDTRQSARRLGATWPIFQMTRFAGRSPGV